MDTVTISKEEYKEFLQYKREKLANALRLVESEFTNLFGNPRAISTFAPTVTVSHHNGKDKNGKSRKGSVGWKGIINDILKASEKHLTFSEIVEAAVNNPDLEIDKGVAQKSIGSNLAAYSKGANPRYVSKKVDGKLHYKLNKEYMEQ